jgi:glycosyltransferase involved in cell wall biosynthesis
MNILWITNTIFPEPSEKLGLNKPVSGGWMYGLAKQLSKQNGTTMAVASTWLKSEYVELDIDSTKFYVLPNLEEHKYPQHLEAYWKKIIEQYQPDIIHIHGTEYQNALACMRANPTQNYIISVQGLVSVIAKYQYAGIPMMDIIRNITIRDVLRKDTIIQRKKYFEKCAVFEREYFERTKHVIGRTSFDYAHTRFLNRNSEYHFCNETLRIGFYNAKKWDINTMKQHTIFLSQSERTFKGLHKLLGAANLLKKEFPTIAIRIAGGNIISTKTFKDRLRLSGYGNYIKKLLDQYGLIDHVTFTGPLNEEGIISEYLNANVFVCPSSIENSPNSLAEAQILGVPSIAAYVGGVPDMITHKHDGLIYRFEEVEMLAESIRELFVNKSLANSISKNGLLTAEARHNATVNFERIIDIYNKILI